MNETIDLMKKHTSVRRFTDEQISDEDLKAIIDAGRAASSWKNFQSYSIIVVRSQEKKAALFDLVPQEAIRQSSVFLLFNLLFQALHPPSNRKDRKIHPVM